MTPLIKIQLKDYESGEFSDPKQRSCPDTLDLIDHFPWTEQCDHIAIGPTNPSITIEGASGDYLKLAPATKANSSFYAPRRFNSFLINPSSRPVCPDMELFSWARRIR